MKKQTVLRKLAELKAPLLQFGVTKLGLFGSTVRGENKPGSDIDVLIDFQPEKETFQNFMAVCDMLESFFKRQKLDMPLVNTRGFVAHRRPQSPKARKSNLV